MICCGIFMKSILEFIEQPSYIIFADHIAPKGSTYNDTNQYKLTANASI